jgi:hypothetical protein
MKALTFEQRIAGVCVSANAVIAVFTGIIAPVTPWFSRATWIWSIHAFHILVVVVALTHSLTLFFQCRSRLWLVAALANALIFAAAVGRTLWLIEHSLRPQ